MLLLQLSAMDFLNVRALPPLKVSMRMQLARAVYATTVHYLFFHALTYRRVRNVFGFYKAIICW
jgi:hypothetical protein